MISRPIANDAHPMDRRFLGVFVPTFYLQDEGIEHVLDRLMAAGTRAIAIEPTIGRQATGSAGSRFPDLHIDGFERILDRPLWGHRELRVETFSAYRPDLDRYGSGPYRPTHRPPPPSQLATPDVVQATIDEAHRRGLQVHFALHPFVIPDVRAQDLPITITGDPGSGPRVAGTACLNSLAARAYGLGLVRDVVAAFPEVDGLFLDWAEFPAYALDDLFSCFCTSCEHAAHASGIRWDDVTRDVRATWDWSHRLTSHELRGSRRRMRRAEDVVAALADAPGWLEFIRFKARSVVQFHRDVRAALDQDGHSRVSLTARGWPPPWNLVSGMNYRSLAGICEAAAPKLFTFDFAALPRWYGTALKRWNPDLEEAEILDALVEVMALPDAIAERTFARYQIPAPEELHHTDPVEHAGRIQQVIDQVGGRVPCYPIIHAYLPEPQWKRMVAVGRDGPADGIWVQMYGYLSDRKLEIMRDVWAAGSR